MATSFSSASSLTSDSIKNNNNNFYLHHNTAFLLKSDKGEGISGDGGRLDLNTGHLKRNDDYFKDRTDLSEKIDFFRGANFINTDIYRGKSPNADYGRPYPDLYPKPDAKTDYFRVAEYYRKNPNEFFYRETKSPELSKKNGERSPGLDFLRPKSPKDGCKGKLDDFRRHKDTDGEFLKPNCGAGGDAYHEYGTDVKSGELYRKSPDYAGSERCSVISNNSDNSSEVQLRLKPGEEDFAARDVANSVPNGVMNIVNSSISGYHGASSSPPVSGEMKYMPPAQHHHHHHHHHQVRPYTIFTFRFVRS